MRKMTMLAAAGTLALAPMAYAQEQTPPAQQAPAATESGQSAAPQIQKIAVVDVQELPEAEQTRVNEAAGKMPEAELQNLRQSIDAHAQAKAALDAEGLTSQNVIVAMMGSDGTLTLVTKKG
jgi:hypothetical protein